MKIRYKLWGKTAQPMVHKVFHRAKNWLFSDADKGVCDVTDRQTIEFLLSHSARYAVAYEEYGVIFDAKDQEVQVEEPVRVEENGKPKRRRRKQG